MGIRCQKKLKPDKDEVFETKKMWKYQILETDLKTNLKCWCSHLACCWTPLTAKQLQNVQLPEIWGKIIKLNFVILSKNTKSRKLSKTKPKVLELSFSLLLNSRNGENSQNDQIPEIWGIIIKMQLRVALSPTIRKHLENQKSKRG